MTVAGIDMAALAEMAAGDPDEAVPVTRRWLQQAHFELDQHRRCGACFGLEEGQRI